MTTKTRTGTYELACGHTVKAALDTQTRYLCPECDTDTFVLRVVTKKPKPRAARRQR